MSAFIFAFIAWVAAIIWLTMVAFGKDPNIPRAICASAWMICTTLVMLFILGGS